MITFKKAAVSFGFLALVFAQCAANPHASIAPDVCKVGEGIEVGPGPCTGEDGAKRCQEMCNGTLVNAYVTGSCSPPRPGGDQECICSSKCMFGGSWGDPHFRSFDGAALQYHGVCQLALVKTIEPMKTVPSFELRMTGKQWEPHSLLTIPGELELIVPEWKIKIAVNRDDKLTVNGHITQTPYAFSMLNGRILNFIQINMTKTSIRDISAYTITTSFGLSIIKEISISYDRGNGIYVYLPRHPEIMGNIGGMLGNGDGNIENDSIDNRGKKRVLTGITLDGWQFGDSYCINKSEILPKKVELEHIEQHRQRMKDCKAHSDKFKVMTSMCNKIQSINYENCLDASAVQAVIEECLVDACYAPTSTEGDVLCSVVEILNRKCLLDRKCD